MLARLASPRATALRSACALETATRIANPFRKYPSQWRRDELDGIPGRGDLSPYSCALSRLRGLRPPLYGCALSRLRGLRPPPPLQDLRFVRGASRNTQPLFAFGAPKHGSAHDARRAQQTYRSGRRATNRTADVVRRPAMPPRRTQCLWPTASCRPAN